MGIKATVDGTNYNDIDMITVGQKNIVLTETVSTSEKEAMYERILTQSNNNLGDIVIDFELPCISLTCRTVENISFPNATVLSGNFDYLSANNFLAPNAAETLYFTPSTGQKGNMFTMKNANIKGVVDLSGLLFKVVQGNQTFYGSTINTLKIGAMNTHNDFLGKCTITNLVWNISSSIVINNAIAGLKGAKSITNLYIPDEFKTTISDSNISTIKNIYSISDWSDK